MIAAIGWAVLFLLWLRDYYNARRARAMHEWERWRSNEDRSELLAVALVIYSGLWLYLDLKS